MALKIIGIIILFFAFLLSLKATVTVEYNGEVALSVRVLFIKLRILPKKEKKRSRSMSRRKAQRLRAAMEKKEAKKKEKAAKKKAAKAEKKAQSASAKKKKLSGQEIVDIVSLICQLVRAVIETFFGHLRIKLARIRLVIATGDAATTAIAYGAVTQSINVLFPLLESVRTLSLPVGDNISVSTDFTSDRTEIDVKLSFSLRVWHLFHVALAALWRLIKHTFKVQKRKDSAGDSTH